MKILLIILAILLIIWILFTVFAIRGIEEPKYTVIEKKEGYEIREYEWYIVAEVEVSGDMRTALNQGFRLLAGYIFGGNVAKKSISMTVPVMDTTKTSESISMTAPVMDTLDSSGKHIVAFTMPSSYTIENLPIPNSWEIKFRAIPRTKRAALSYSWYATEHRVEEKKALLLELLKIDGFTTLGSPTSAQYNPPLSFPPLRRNEVMIDVK